MSQVHWRDYYHGDAPISRPDQPVVVKAGEGATFTDPAYRGFCKDAAAAGQPAFAYYALHAGSMSEMIAQARRAAGIIGRRPAMYDVERWPAESGSAPGIASVEMVLTAVDAYRAAGGVIHVTYLPRSQWEGLGRPDLRPLAKSGLVIMNADYRPGASNPTHPAWSPYGGITPWAVQYAPSHNVAPGTLADFLRVWQQGPAAAPPPAPGTYTAVKGDTMASIAAAHGITLGTLEHLNPRAGHPPGNFNLIFPGDVFVVRGEPR